MRWAKQVLFILALVTMGTATLAALLGVVPSSGPRTAGVGVATTPSGAPSVVPPTRRLAQTGPASVDPARDPAVGAPQNVHVDSAAHQPPFDARIDPAAHGTARLHLIHAGGEIPASGVEVVATREAWTRTALTGLDGRVVFEVPPGEVRFDVRKAGAACNGWSWRFDPGEVRDYTLLLFPAGGIVRGVVVDPSGRPVIGAVVEWDGESTRTDTQGRFELEGLAEDERVLHVFAPGFRLGVDRVTAEPPPGASVRMVLQTEVQLVGVVAAVGTNAPAEWVVDVDRGPRALALDSAVVDGRFLIERLPGGRKVNVLVRGVDTQGGIWIAQRALQLEPTGTTRASFEPAGPGAVAGRVVRRGRSPAGLLVSVGSDGGLVQKNLELSDDGAFELKSYPSGVARVRVLASDVGSANPTAEVQVVTGQTSWVDLVLNEGWELSGLVIDSTGTPISSAYVELSQVGPEVHTRAAGGVNTDKSGRFVARGLPAGRWRLDASGNRLVLGEPIEVAVGPFGSPGDLRLVLSLPGGLVIRLTDTADQPISAALVSVTRLDERRDRFRPATDHAGRIELDNVTPGRVRVELTDYARDDVLARVARRRNVRATRCEPIAVDIRAGETAQVSLRVVDVP